MYVFDLIYVPFYSIQIQLLEFELLTSYPDVRFKCSWNRCCECIHNTSCERYFGQFVNGTSFFPAPDIDCFCGGESGEATCHCCNCCCCYYCRQSESFVNGILKTLTCYVFCILYTQHRTYIFIHQFGHGSPTQNTPALHELFEITIFNLRYLYLNRSEFSVHVNNFAKMDLVKRDVGGGGEERNEEMPPISHLRFFIYLFIVWAVELKYLRYLWDNNFDDTYNLLNGLSKEKNCVVSITCYSSIFCFPYFSFFRYRLVIIYFLLPLYSVQPVFSFSLYQCSKQTF